MSAKYLLCPGYVISKTDGQRHFVGEQELARLYGVPMTQCEVQPERYFSRFGWRPPEGAIRLEPRYDGRYSLPEASKGGAA
jgi:hypothetical protein